MLVASLILSFVLLVAVNVTAYRSRSSPHAPSWWVLGLLVPGLGLGMVVLPTFLLHAALTLVAVLACAWLSARPRMFLATSLAAFFVAYVGPGVWSWVERSKPTPETAPVAVMDDESRLREETASVSLADRLAYEQRPLLLPDSQGVGADMVLISLPVDKDNMDAIFQGQTMGSIHRAHALRLLHENG